MNYGLNFRGSTVFVTDPANTTYVVATDLNAGDVSRGGGTFALTATPGDFQFTDLSAGVDARLAGRGYTLPNVSASLKIDLDTGLGATFDVRVAIGDAVSDQSAQHQIVKIYDGNPLSGGTLLATIDKTTGPGAGQWYDASGVLRTSESDWINNNAPVTATFANTECWVVIGATGAGYTVFAHVQIQTHTGAGLVLTGIAPTAVPLAGVAEDVTIAFTITGTDLSGSSPDLTPPTGWTVVGSLTITATTIDGLITIPNGESAGTKTFTFTTSDGSDSVGMSLSSGTGGGGRISSPTMRGGFVN